MRTLRRWMRPLGLWGLTLVGLAWSAAVWAQSWQGFSPQQYPSGLHYGQGVFSAPKQFSLYAQPGDETPLDTLTWQKGQSGLTLRSTKRYSSVPASKLFLCFYPEKDLALMAVVGDQETADGRTWLEVVVDQTTGKTAWVPVEANAMEAGAFRPWLDFMKQATQPSGFRWLYGVPEQERALHMAPQDTSKLLQNTLLRNIRVRHVRGNWLLVEALDLERNAPIGWVRWRDEAGQLMVFPNVEGIQQPPVVLSPARF